QYPIRIGGRQHDGIGDDIGDDLRRHPDLLDLGGEYSSGKSIDGESRVLPVLDAGNVALVDPRVDLQAVKVAGYDEQRFRFQAGRKRLRLGDVASNHDAVDGRADLGPFKVKRCAVPEGVEPDLR